MVRVQDIMKNEYIAVHDNEPLTRLFGRLLQQRQTDAFVFSSASPSARELVGMFAYPYLPFRVDSKDVAIRTVTRPVPQLQPNDTVLRAGQLFFESGLTSLPVLEDEKLVGVVRAFDALPHLCRIDGVVGLRVRDIQNIRTATIRHDASLGELITVLRDERLDRIPVVDERGEFAGFVSYLDLVENYYVRTYTRDEGMAPGATGSINTRAFHAEPTDPLDLPVHNFMSVTDAINIEGSDTLAVAVERMIERGVLSLVILDGRKPSGMVSLHDVFHTIMSSQVQEIPAIQYRGLRELDIDDYALSWLHKISSYYVQKLQVSVDNDVEVIVHIKERSRSGDTHRYTVNTRMNFPGATLTSEAQEWDLRRAVHEAFQGLEVELSHFLQRDGRVLSVQKLAAQTGNPNLPGDLASS